MTRSLGRSSMMWRTRLLGGCSAVCLSLWMSHPALAQDRRGWKADDSFYERFYVSLEGGWLINNSPDNFSFGGQFSAAGPLTPGQHNGGSFGVEVGGAFSPLYDWRARWRGNTFKAAQNSASSTGTFDSFPTFQAASASDTLRFHTFDGEIGYRPAGSPFRLFAGVRALKSTNTVSYNYESDKFGPAGGTSIGSGSHDAQVLGIGPRAGLELTVPFPGPRTFLTVGGSFSAIFAKQDHTFNGTQANNPFSGIPSTTITSKDFSRNLTIYNTEASAVLGYRFTNYATLGVGYRMQYFSNMVPMISGVNTGSASSGFVTGNGDVLVHGPVAKLTIGWK